MHGLISPLGEREREMMSHSHMKGKKAISLRVYVKDLGKHGMWLLFGLSLLALIYIYCSTLQGFSTTNESLLSHKDDVSTTELSTGAPNTKVQDQFGSKIDKENVEATELDDESFHILSSKELNESNPSGEALEKVEHQNKISCNYENKDYDLCEMEGDIRIHGKSSSVMFIDPNRYSNETEPNETWIIRPHARKFHWGIMQFIREVEVKTSIDALNAPKCDINHKVPAVIFSLSTNSENYYHSYVDVLVPLFITSRQFNGEVQFLVSMMTQKWIKKHEIILSCLSHYEIIDFDKEEKVHCYPHVIVGSYRHNDLIIDPSRSPNNYTMVDFGLFVRKAFSLKRDHLIKNAPKSKRKPRLFIIARKRIRQFRNINSIISMAEKFGFKVVSGEVPHNVNEAANFINSFDVIMGVHGSGLTNVIFLPTNAIVIQIVPYGNIEWMAHYDFGAPSIDMKLNYLQYSIDVDESSLTEIYPRDHPVLTDINTIREQSWDKYWDIYFEKQDVKLNVTRFRPTLVKALELLK